MAPPASADASSLEKPDLQMIAHHVWQLKGQPPDQVNTYLIEDVLIDASTRDAAPRLLSQLTHCHPDHQGSAKQICETRGVPLACPEADVAAMEGRAPMLPRNAVTWLVERIVGGPAYPVQRILRDGDEAAPSVSSPNSTLPSSASDMGLYCAIWSSLSALLPACASSLSCKE
jgi:hypothetical protein